MFKKSYNLVPQAHYILKIFTGLLLALLRPSLQTSAAGLLFEIIVRILRRRLLSNRNNGIYFYFFLIH